MIGSGKSRNDLPLEASISAGTAPLESILCTEELQRRPSRPPDYEKENHALVKLVSALADSPSTIFQTLAETIQDITQCDSSGLSLLTKDGKTPQVDGQRFYWPAIAGMWNPHVGGGTPRNFGPCGDVLDQNRALLFTHFERRYPYLIPVNPAAEECLLVPIYVGGKAVGTIWGIMHSDRRKFDAEDDRIMASLGKFASSAYQALAHIEELKIQVAEREKAEAEVRQLASGLEAKIRRLVEANVVGIVMWNLDGGITGANEAFLRMVQYNRDDLASGRVRWADLTPAEWRGHDEQALADLKVTGIFQPFEKEYFRKDGSRVPVLLGGALFEESGNEGVAFVLDLSEQKRAEEALQKAQAELAHVTRVATVGELTASIAHEINQPLAAVVTNANASLRWLSRDSPNLAEACEAIRRIVRDGNRAGEVIARMRALFKKASTTKERLDINQAIEEVVTLAQTEVQRNRVSLQSRLANDLLPVMGDRIQLQQVILNLIINAIEAISGEVSEGPRDLLVSSQKVTEIPSQLEKGTFEYKALADAECTHVLIAVRDSGPGLDPKGLDRLFDAFYTTKPKGLGMGLAISRSIIEAHRGRLWARPNAPRGAVFRFTLPICYD